MAITHPFVSAVADGSDATLVRPSNWNAAHTIADDTITSAMMAASSVNLATDTVTGILPTANGGTGIAFFTAAGPTVARVYTFPDSAATILYSGGALGTPSSGTLTNATGLPEGGLSLTDLTTNNASATQHGFVPKWPNNTTTFFRGDGTYAAPTAGNLTGHVTSTGLATVLGSFTIAQLSTAISDANISGNNTGDQTITLTGPITGSGTGSFATSVAAQTGTGTTFVMQTSPTLTTPNIGAATGTSLVLGTGVAGSGLFDVIGDSGSYLFRADATAVGWAFGVRKSRGTASSPTVITTGDSLGTHNWYGYVGATNTFQRAAAIQALSTGVISDSATGIGGKLLFLTAIVGAEPVTVATITSQHVIHSGTAPTITAGGGTAPSIVGTDESFTVTIGTGGVATTVEITFGNAFTTNAPNVSVTSDTDIVSFKITPLTNKVTITATAAFTAGSKLYCIARGWE